LEKPLSPSPSKRLVFVLRPIHFVRHFKDAVRIWLANGHQVHILFDTKLENGEIPEILKPDLAEIERLQNQFPQALTFEIQNRFANEWTPISKSIRTLRDYLRYFSKEYERAAFLRERLESQIPDNFIQLMKRPLLRKHWVVSLLCFVLDLLERALPVNQKVAAYLAQRAPDVVIVSPLIYVGSGQTEFLKAAKSLGIRSVFAVASWDNLTNKGVVKTVPELMTLWNGVQKDEAIRMHGIPAEKIAITGAQTFDECFRWKPTVDKDTFLKTAGLRPDQPFLLYLCSSKNISLAEQAFIGEWLAAVRRASDVRLSSLGVLIRPYPLGGSIWEGKNLSEFGNITVWPPTGELTYTPDALARLYDSIYYCEAVVGLNTSAMLEAAILSKPVLTVIADGCDNGQEGTLHFQYIRDGLVDVARSLGKHIASLSALFDGQDPFREKRKAFVQSFLRPQGIELDSAPFLAAAVEQQAAKGPIPVSMPPRWLAPLRWFLRRQLPKGKLTLPIAQNRVPA